MTREDAIDVIFGHARDAMNSAGLATPGVNQFFQNIVSNPPEDIPWGHAFLKHADDAKQRGFGARGKRRYVQKGVLWIKLRVPTGDGSTNHVPITQKVVDYFQRLRVSNVSYVRIRAVEDGTHGSFYVTDFMTDFSYDVFN